MRGWQGAIGRYFLIKPDLAPVLSQPVGDRPQCGVCGGELDYDAARQVQGIIVVVEPQAKHLVHKPTTAGHGLGRAPGDGSGARSLLAMKRPGQPGRGNLLEVFGNCRTGHPGPMAGPSGPETTGLSIQPSLRANRTQCSIGFGSVKYITPPSFSPSAGITLKPWSARKPITSSKLYSWKVLSVP